MAGLALAAEHRQFVGIELLARLADRVQRNQCILEFCRSLPFDRLAFAVEAVDVVSADILLFVGSSAGPWRGTPVDPLAHFAAGRGFIVVKTFFADERALGVRLEGRTIVAGGECMAQIGPVPRPAGLCNGHAVHDPRDGIA